MKGLILLLAMVGKPLPKTYYPNAGAHPTARQMYKWGSELERKVTAKTDVVRMFEEAVTAAERNFRAADEAELNRPAEFFGEKTTIRRIYLRILAHTGEHLG